MKEEYDFSNGTRGPVLSVDPNTTKITFRVDDDLLSWFKEQVRVAGGGNYQKLMNKALREFKDE